MIRTRYARPAEGAGDIHPEDMLREFSGRTGVLGALGEATIDLYDLQERSGIGCEPPVSRQVAIMLRELGDDFMQLQAAVSAWFDANPTAPK